MIGQLVTIANKSPSSSVTSAFFRAASNSLRTSADLSNNAVVRDGLADHEDLPGFRAASS